MSVNGSGGLSWKTITASMIATVGAALILTAFFAISNHASSDDLREVVEDVQVVREEVKSVNAASSERTKAVHAVVTIEIKQLRQELANYREERARFEGQVRHALGITGG